MNRTVSGTTRWRTVRLTIQAGVLFALVGVPAGADIEPETVSVSALGDPQDTWFLAKSIMGPANLFDAATGEMLGLLSLSPWTPAVAPSRARGEIYSAETYYTRRVRGERNDVLTVYDRQSLEPTGEVDIPDKIAALPFRHYVALLDDGRHLAVFNMTPAQSVSIVDVQTRRFVGEISTPGCALAMPSIDRSFLMLCGDGTLQLIRLDRQGRESTRVRSAEFFDLDTDPVFDKPVATPEGWLLVSNEGRVFTVAVDGTDIAVSEPWSLLTDEDREEGWRIGGGQIMAHHPGLDLMMTLMHVGEADTHEEPGTEIWLFDRSEQRRVARITLDAPVTTLYVTPNDEPLLVAARQEGPIDIFDLRTATKVRTIAEPGLVPALLQEF